jgi:hypothetical protein
MRYIDVNVTVRIRIPFNGAEDEQAIIDDLYVLSDHDYDSINIRRNRFDANIVDSEGQFIQPFNPDGTTGQIYSENERHQIISAVVVGRGELE